MKPQSSYKGLVDVIHALPRTVFAARQSRGLSLRLAANQIDCAFSTLRRFEQGEEASVTTVMLMLLWLDRLERIQLAQASA